MSECIDPRYERMLHAFELGLLAAEDREAFEEHLLDCDHCHDQAKEFMPVSSLMQHDSIVRNLQGEGERTSDTRLKSWFRFTRLAAIAAVLVAIAIPTYWLTFRDNGFSDPVQRLYFVPTRGGDPPILYLDRGGTAVISFAVDSLIAASDYRTSVTSRTGETVVQDVEPTRFDSPGLATLVLPMTVFEAGYYRLSVAVETDTALTRVYLYNFKVR